MKLEKLRYLIRRFFRIYVPYFVFVTVFVATELTHSVVYGITYESWFDLILLKKAGKNHLWTIIPEIRYYIIIPIFTFLTFKMQKYFIPWISFIIISSFCIEKFNLLGMKCKALTTPDGENIVLAFLIFLNGSIIGVIYYQIDKCSNGFEFLKRFKFLLDIFASLMYIYGLKLTSTYFLNKSLTNIFVACTYNASLYWSIFIFFLLFITEESMLANVLNSKLLKKFGFYSFGMYLLHWETFRVVKFLSENNIIGQTSIEYTISEFFVIYFYGVIFFHLIENPAMNLGDYILKRI
jgi:peptidoglycan/LPS O-acetylase OafA/YrhL